ncbi:MAG: tetratricopeptide repeat protein [Geitlerinemataceae cyanobacterium]
MNFKNISIATLLLGGLASFSEPALANSSSDRTDLDIAFENTCAVVPEAMPQEFRPPTFERQPLPENLDTAKAWQTIGENAAVSGDYHNAIQAFNKAIDLSRGNNPELLEQRGWLHYTQDNYQQAIADLKAAALLYDDMENTTDRWDTCNMVSYVERQRV